MQSINGKFKAELHKEIMKWLIVESENYFQRRLRKIMIEVTVDYFFYKGKRYTKPYIYENTFLSPVPIPFEIKPDMDKYLDDYESWDRRQKAIGSYLRNAFNLCKTGSDFKKILPTPVFDYMDTRPFLSNLDYSFTSTISDNELKEFNKKSEKVILILNEQILTNMISKPGKK